MNLVPGSRFETRAADANATNGVIRGEFRGNYTGGTTVSHVIVPGSDAFD